MPSTSEHTSARLRHIPKYTSSSYVGKRLRRLLGIVRAQVRRRPAEPCSEHAGELAHPAAHGVELLQTLEYVFAAV